MRGGNTTRGGRGRGPMIAFVLAAAGVAVHALALARFAAEYGQLPLNGLAPSLSTVALIVGIGLVFVFTIAAVQRFF